MFDCLARALHLSYIVPTSLLGLTVGGVSVGVLVALSLLSVVVGSGLTLQASPGCCSNEVLELLLFTFSIKCKFSESTGNEVCTPRRRKIQRCTTPLQASIKPWSKETSLSKKKVKHRESGINNNNNCHNNDLGFLNNRQVITVLLRVLWVI